MAGPADEARQLVDQRTVQLAKLHWALQSHSTRVEVAMRWLAAVEVPPRAARPAAVTQPSAALGPMAGQEQVVLPPDGAAPGDPESRRLRVIVSESREVSLEVEDKMPAPAPELGTRYRLAS